MHWVARGPELDGLAAIRTHYTPRWIRHYRDGQGFRPHDARWQEFRGDLRKAFQELCAYCEEHSNEEVDHFRPVKRFPEQVYHWSNWVLACASCNRTKGAKWSPKVMWILVRHPRQNTPKPISRLTLSPESYCPTMT